MSTDEPRSADTGPATRTPIPLNYAQRQGIRQWEQSVTAQVATVGGWRQAGFAFGLAFTLCGLGYAMSQYDLVPAALMGLGGLLIGLCVRVPRWKD